MRFGLISVLLVSAAFSGEARLYSRNGYYEEASCSSCPAASSSQAPAQNPTDFLLPLLLFGLLLYLISQNNNNNVNNVPIVNPAGRRRREDDWPEDLTATIQSYASTAAGNRTCDEFFVCWLNQKANQYGSFNGILLKETSLLISEILNRNNIVNISVAANRGFYGADCQSLYPNCI